MKTLDQRALDALAALPPEMRERAVDFLEEQAEKIQHLRRLLAEAEDDVSAGLVSDWDFEAFLQEARSRPPRD